MANKTPYKLPVKKTKYKIYHSERDISELDRIDLIEETMSDADFKCFTGGIVHRNFEIDAREELVNAYQEISKITIALRQNSAIALMGFSKEAKEVKLSDLLQQTGNPETLEELASAISEKYGFDIELPRLPLPPKTPTRTPKSRKASFKIRGSKTLRPSFKKRDLRVRLKRLNADEVPILTDESGSDDGSTREIFTTPDQATTATTAASPEIFTTPKSKCLGLTPPRPPRTYHTSNKNCSQILFPSPSEMLAGTRAVSAGSDGGRTDHVFQFQGTSPGGQEPRAKMPRAVKPGEVVFSKTGSPILSQADAKAILPQTPTPAGSTVLKPIRIQVEDGDGKAIEVDIIYRAKGVEVPAAEEAKLFRAFLTDVRGVASTMKTTCRGKRTQPARVPPKPKKKGWTPR